MKELSGLFENNRRWAESMTATDPDFFLRLSRQQSPQYLWIGCSDSRVPANQIIGLQPGEVFVHRNVANIVGHTDFNCLSVLQFAVEVLKVRHVIVCGHYGCGGVLAAMDNSSHGLIDNWLRDIKDIYAKNCVELDHIADPVKRSNRLCELNVSEQVRNVCCSTIVQNAWSNQQPLSVHGWVYSLTDGLLLDLDLCVSGPQTFEAIYANR